MAYIKFLTLLFSIQVFSQNLVLNPSFENTNDCIKSTGYIGNSILYWTCPTTGTTDFFNSCEVGETGVPRNFKGMQYAKSGNNYVGFGMLRGYSMEYIQGQLSEKLIKGEKYKVSFYISLAEQSNFAINSFNILFTEEEINANILGELSSDQLNKLKIKNYSYHNIKSSHYFDNKDNWMLISKDIIATGNEKFIVIGDFTKHFRTDKIRVSRKPKKMTLSYYYLDMVCVERIDSLNKEVKPFEQLIQKPKDQKIELNKVYTFSNVIFDSNSTELSDDAKLEVVTIYQFLKHNPNTTISIIGHTDDIGTFDFNQKLSTKRANSVAVYFKSLGLNKNRIKVVGYGNSIPISTNKTKEGRKINRRVEFKIVNND